jgi:hypothetical protein
MPTPSRQLNLQEIFTYHRPFGDQPFRYQAIRETALKLGELILATCPDSRERSLAITNLQQAVMWANSSIAINEKEKDSEK